MLAQALYRPLRCRSATRFPIGDCRAIGAVLEERNRIRHAGQLEHLGEWRFGWRIEILHMLKGRLLRYTPHNTC
jgi:hypothetical protein